MIQTVVPPKEVIHHERVVSHGRAIDYCLSSAACEWRLDRRTRWLPRCPLGYAPVGEQLQKTHAILQQERRLLESNAYIDPLTNLGNRNGFDRHVEQLWHKGDPFTCAYIDIDHLKHCNDRFGHAEGNRYILSICRTLSETMKHDEMLFRIGGDEFVLISLSANETELEQRLEQVRAGLIEASSDGKAP